MHELSVAQEVLNIVEREVGGEKKVLSVALTLGPLSGICADSLQFCFSLIAADRGFGETELVINEVPARLHCNGCGLDYELDDLIQGCPRCGSFVRTLLGGSEFTLDAVEVEEE